MIDLHVWFVISKQIKTWVSSNVKLICMLNVNVLPLVKEMYWKIFTAREIKRVVINKKLGFF